MDIQYLKMSLNFSGLGTENVYTDRHCQFDNKCYISILCMQKWNLYLVEHEISYWFDTAFLINSILSFLLAAYLENRLRWSAEKIT